MSSAHKTNPNRYPSRCMPDPNQSYKRQDMSNDTLSSR